MGAIVGGVILVVIGAIINYALEFDMPGIDSHALGMILMVAGVVLFLVGLLMAFRSRRTVVSTTREPNGTISERRDPPPEV